MKAQFIFISKKYQKKNLNKFLNLKKKNSTSSIILSSASMLKDPTKRVIDSFLKRKSPLIKFNWIIKVNKNRTKKPIGSKLGGGKSKIDYFFTSLKKYKPIITSGYPSQLLRIKLNNINKILNFKLRWNVK